ncbi:MAG: CPBP family intramembrane metalloprotease [Gemmatimonadetes bacterium]|nr:CPBP family intramembrane metalloprotease [Gemmatimonadota bacterium]
MPEDSRRVIGVGAVVYLVVVALFAGETSLTVADVLVLPVLLVVLPALGVAQVAAAAGQPLPPQWVLYAVSGGSTLLLGVVALAAGVYHGGLAAVGLRAAPSLPLAGWTFGLILAGLVLTVFSRLLAGRYGIQETRLLRELLPVSVAEKWAFVLLSLSAGFGEELAYRGYAIPILEAATGSLWPAVAISSIAFGIVHAYQGPFGVVRTTLLGFLLGLPVALTGNVWPAILAHTALDVVNGVVLGRWLVALGATEEGQPDGN